jgi:hypothetical protein
MNDSWDAAAAEWGYRSDFQTPRAATLDCSGRGDEGDGGSGGGSGGSGGGSGQGGTTTSCRCACCRHGCRGGCASCEHKSPCGCPEHPHHHAHHHDHCGHDHRHDELCTCDRGGGRGHHRSRGRGYDDGGSDAKGGGSSSGSSAGTTLGWKNPRRPGRRCGTSTGLVPGGYVDLCDFVTPPWNQWPGQRGDLYLPFLFIRANPGDLGAPRHRSVLGEPRHPAARWGGAVPGTTHPPGARPDSPRQSAQHAVRACVELRSRASPHHRRRVLLVRPVTRDRPGRSPSHRPDRSCPRRPRKRARPRGREVPDTLFPPSSTADTSACSSASGNQPATDSGRHPGTPPSTVTSDSATSTSSRPAAAHRPAL